MSWRVTRVKMWEHGHSFEEIDNMSLTDVSDVVGYWSGKARGEERLRRTHQKLRKQY